MWIITILLIVLDQGIKLIINQKFLSSFFTILKPILYFKPIFNRDYSWFNSIFQLGLGKWLHVFIVTIILMFLILFYMYIKSTTHFSSIINITFAFLFAGTICSLIDKIFWNGSLDYILVKGLFTFDLKDVYINIFIGLIILFLVIDYKNFRSINDTEIIEGFKKFILKKY